MKKHKGLWIAAVLVVLAAAIAVLAWLNAPKGEVDAGSVAIVQNGETLRSFTMDEIQAMDYAEVEKEIVSSSHANDAGLFRGVPLQALLEAAGADTAAGAGQIVVRATDGFVSAYSAEEVAAGSILLVYAKDGEGLGDLERGGSGPFRILIPDDEFGNRSAKYVYEIEVR